MKEQKKTKQSCIGNFFQKAKEPSLWTAVSDDSTENAGRANVLQQKTPSAKSNGKLKAAKSQKKCGSRVLSCKSNEDLFLKTPETAPKRKSLIGQKSKSRLSLDKNNDKGKEERDLICIDENVPDKNIRRNNPFLSKSNGSIALKSNRSVCATAKEDTAIKSRKSSGGCNSYPDDSLCIISDDEDGFSANVNKKDIPEDKQACGKRSGIFTKIRPSNSVQKWSPVLHDSNPGKHKKNKDDVICDVSHDDENAFSKKVKTRKSKQTTYTVPCLDTSNHDSDSNQKTSKLKLKRLDNNKRMFRFGSSGVSPMKKRQAKDDDMAVLRTKDTNSETRKSNNHQANSTACNISNKPFGKRSLFSDEITDTASNHRENFDTDITKLNEPASNHKSGNDRKTYHSEAREYRRNSSPETRKCYLDDGDEDIMLQYANFVNKQDKLKTNEARNLEARKLELHQSISTHSEKLQFKETRDSLEIENNGDQATVNIVDDSIFTDAADITLIGFDDSFQIPNCFEEENKEASKPGACQVKDSIGQASDRLKNIDQLNDSLLDISFNDDFDVAEEITTKDTTVKSVLVLEVTRQEYHDLSNGTQNEKVVRLFDEGSSTEAVCFLRQDWETMEIFPGDSVFITGFKASQQATMILDNKSSEFLTLFPNTLISGTTISMGITCQRRAVLSELFKTDGPNKAMFLGTFLHELFDFAIAQKVFNITALTKEASKLLQKHENLSTLYSLGVEESDFMKNVREYISLLSKWGLLFLKDTPQDTDAIVDFKLGSEVNSDDVIRLSISDIVDIEENIICPSLGLKGKVDASVNVAIHRQPKVQKRIGNQVKNTKIHIPFELKTGKMFSKLGSIEHRAQVILYTLMMSEKYDKKVEAGLLYYLKAGHLQGVPATQKEKRALIMKRNEIVRYLSLENLRNKKLMPGLLKDYHSCKRCPVVNNCMVYHKTVEEGTTETSGIYQQFDEITDHLTKEESIYFLKWYHLIMLEAQEEASSSNHRKLWIESSDERQSSGFCFSQMTLKSEVDQGNQMKLYIFEKKNTNEDCNKNFKDSLISIGDRVIISEENCKTFGLTTGLVQSLSGGQLSVLCNEKITTRSNIKTTLFRIERDASLTSYKIPLGNLMKLFSSQTEHDKKIKQLIVDLSPPRFTWFDSKSLLSLEDDRQQGLVYLNDEDGQSNLITTSQRHQIRSVFSSLNPDQKQAVEKCLSAQDYVMILGMPGTGKTTTIACIVKTLVALGKSVLITSYTHSAVDNILLKIKQMNLDFLRLGQLHKIHQDIQSYSVEKATASIKSVNGLAAFYEKKKIVATTCLGVNHPLFLKKRFDYCIVDEASQITQPVCFGAIRCANVFVLVGDHYQLPPLVQSMEAKNGGMDISLFKRLSEHHPSAVISLQHQYRMHKDIMALANVLIYDHRMQCGTDTVENTVLRIPKLHRIPQKLHITEPQGQFMCSVLEPSQPVVFIDTDSVNLHESQTDNHISNQSEADLVAWVFRGLVAGAVESNEIGIISPYRNQLKVIKDGLLGICPDVDLADVEINTVDKYQGRDKSCIVVSFVRSNTTGHIGNLLKDWRRINVALTRAKHKLILIGSKKTLSSSPVLKKLIDFSSENDWIIRTPNEILELIK